MKKVNAFVLLFAILMAVTVSSCRNLCKDVTCLYGGACNENDGLCVCTAGYEGTDCGIEIRAKYIGIFKGNESCTQTGSGSLTITISESSSDILEVLITGSWSTFLNPITATIDGNNFTIPSQSPDNNEKQISGSGTITSDQTMISVDYTIVDGGQNVCSATLARQ